MCINDYHKFFYNNYYHNYFFHIKQKNKKKSYFVDFFGSNEIVFFNIMFHLSEKGRGGGGMRVFVRLVDRRK